MTSSFRDTVLMMHWRGHLPPSEIARRTGHDVADVKAVIFTDWGSKKPGAVVRNA